MPAPSFARSFLLEASCMYQLLARMYGNNNVLREHVGCSCQRRADGTVGEPPALTAVNVGPPVPLTSGPFEPTSLISRGCCVVASRSGLVSSKNTRQVRIKPYKGPVGGWGS